MCTDHNTNFLFQAACVTTVNKESRTASFLEIGPFVKIVRPQCNIHERKQKGVDHQSVTKRAMNSTNSHPAARQSMATSGSAVKARQLVSRVFFFSLSLLLLRPENPLASSITRSYFLQNLMVFACCGDPSWCLLCLPLYQQAHKRSEWNGLKCAFTNTSDILLPVTSPFSTHSAVG